MQVLLSQPNIQRRHLQALVAIAEHKSVHAAARALGVPQPALSRLLSEAERILGGTRIFERSSQGSRPTKTGERLIAQARFVLAGLERMTQSAGDHWPHVRVGCIAGAMHTVMPLILERTRPANQGALSVQLKLAEGSSTELLDGIERAQLEFAIVRGAGAVRASRGIELEPLYTERTAIVCGATHTLASAQRIPLNALVDQEWVLPQQQTGSRIVFDNFWSKHGLTPISPVLEARSFETSLALVEKTRFLSIAPEPIAHRHARFGLLRVLNTREVMPDTPVMLAFGSTAMDDPLLRQMRDLIREAAREAKAEGDAQSGAATTI